MSDIVVLEGTQKRIAINIELPHDIILDDCELEVVFKGKRGSYKCSAEYQKKDSENGCLVAVVDSSKTGYGNVKAYIDVYVPDDLVPEGRLLKRIRVDVGYFKKDDRIDV